MTLSVITSIQWVTLGNSEISKTEFMNFAMIVYSKKKIEVETLAKTYTSLRDNKNVLNIK